MFIKKKDCYFFGYINIDSEVTLESGILATVICIQTHMEALHFYILLLVLAWSIFNKYFIPKIKNLPPTPLSISALTIIGNLLCFKQPIHQTLSQIAKRHGPIVLLRFGVRRVLLISSASAAEDLFTNNDVVFANRPKMVPGKEFGHDFTKIAWAPHGALLRHLRRVSFLEILPFHRLQHQHESLADEVKLLLLHLFTSGSQEETVELKPMFQALVCNVMTTMFDGKRYCEYTETAKEKETESISLKDYAIRSFFMTTGKTDIGYFMPVLKSFGLRCLDRSCKKLQGQGDSCMDTIIKEIRNRTSDQFDNGSCQKEENVIQFLLDKQKQDPKRYSDEIIRGLLLEFLSAGNEASAGTLEWALSLLLNNPEIMQKAQNEIASLVGNRLLEPSDIEHLPYLRCIVKETLRLYPVACLLVPHESSKECKVGGYNVPKGTMLLVNVWAIQNDPKIWTEPSKFMPERFQEILDERDGFNLMPFGYGRRSCPGKHMAARVIAFVLGSLIHCYNWESVDKKVDMKEQAARLALLKDKPLMAKCRPRSTTANLLSHI